MTPPSTLGDLLKPIQERVSKATPGEWYRTTSVRYPAEHQLIRSKEVDGTDYAIAEAWGGHGPNQDDAEFIAHSRTDIERLIKCVEVLSEGLENQCTGFRDCFAHKLISQAESILRGDHAST